MVHQRVNGGNGGAGEADLTQPPALSAVMRRFLPSQLAKVTVSQASAPLGGLVKMSGNNCTTRRQGWGEG